jgi:hypothetical protein
MSVSFESPVRDCAFAQMLEVISVGSEKAHRFRIGPSPH